MVKNIVDDKEVAIELLKSLQIRFRTDPKKLEMLLVCTSFLYQRSAGVKMILEHVALTI